ncbi:type II toxin-antitoxin system VapC family toxin [Leptolyngbya sp. FACHB-321]|uniref:type II toxin-antitoxin system VapC family toxin n=1 Tax=Leptolyngbya sp. FACHB-321 TaxID=2692807 RepID=UPI00168990C6|nr:type II toxin-antitoxin system VapC family toxin [Leptolyngbya sp. FACHB-321]MBD2037967.1 type II toxin-antitoxin system VapC family toxin [Leptolyngbya sp. FACHB-321]
MEADVSLSVVTVQELFNGWISQINNSNDVQDLVRLYSKLNQEIALCKQVPVAEFNQAAGDCYQQLLINTLTLSKGRLQKDMRIAAIALSIEATVVARNHQFPKFQGCR